MSELESKPTKKIFKRRNEYERSSEKPIIFEVLNIALSRGARMVIGYFFDVLI